MRFERAIESIIDMEEGNLISPVPGSLDDLIVQAGSIGGMSEDDVDDNTLSEATMESIYTVESISSFMTIVRLSEESQRARNSYSLENNDNQQQQDNNNQKNNNGGAWNNIKAVLGKFVATIQQWVQKAVLYIRKMGIDKKVANINSNWNNVEKNIKSNGGNKQIINPKIIIDFQREFPPTAISFITSDAARHRNEIEKFIKEIDSFSPDGQKIPLSTPNIQESLKMIISTNYLQYFTKFVTDLLKNTKGVLNGANKQEGADVDSIKLAFEFARKLYTKSIRIFSQYISIVNLVGSFNKQQENNQTNNQQQNNNNQQKGLTFGKEQPKKDNDQ